MLQISGHIFIKNKTDDPHGLSVFPITVQTLYYFFFLRCKDGAFIPNKKIKAQLFLCINYNWAKKGKGTGGLPIPLTNIMNRGSVP